MTTRHETEAEYRMRKGLPLTVEQQVADAQHVGDVNSTERGSGARYNAGKPQLEQIPLGIWTDYFAGMRLMPEWTLTVMEIMAGMQQHGFTECDATWADILQAIPLEHMEAAARVFAYGAKKYAQWNWTKGMQWHIPVGCMLRHFRAFAEGEVVDPESEETHLGHAVCNIIMLYYFNHHYPEGRGWIFPEDV